MFIELINKYIVDFLENNKNNNDIVSNWKNKKNQQNFFKILKKTNVKIKDPEKPKRGKSAFLFYCEEHREKLKKEFPLLTVKEIVSKLGNNWQDLKKNNKEEVKKYEEMSLNDRNRYKNEMKSYVPVFNRKLTSKKEKKKSTRRSKRTKTEIMYDNFLKMKISRTKRAHPELESSDVLTYLKNKWENMADEKKEKYYKRMYCIKI